MENRYSNQLDIINPEFAQSKVVVIWAGGIWVGTVMCLAQMWIKDISVCDFDDVENHNLASQLYKESDIWKNKVIALRDNVYEFTWITIKVEYDKFNKDMVKDADIVIMAVDNMATRKEIMEACTSKTIRYLDCRMWGSFFEIHMYIPELEDSLYLKTWFTDEEASPVTCTNKSVSYNTFAIAGIIWRIVVGIINNEEFILNKHNIQVDLKNLLIW